MPEKKEKREEKAETEKGLSKLSRPITLYVPEY
jgi:hypothetical protein